MPINLLQITRLRSKWSSTKQAEAVSLRPESFEIRVCAEIFIDKIELNRRCQEGVKKVFNEASGLCFFSPQVMDYGRSQVIQRLNSKKGNVAMMHIEGMRAYFFATIVNCVLFASGCSPAAVTQTVENAAKETSDGTAADAQHWTSDS